MKEQVHGAKPGGRVDDFPASQRLVPEESSFVWSRLPDFICS